jgi:hypothetical protein
VQVYIQHLLQQVLVRSARDKLLRMMKRLITLLPDKHWRCVISSYVFREKLNRAVRKEPPSVAEARESKSKKKVRERTANGFWR